MLDPCCKYMHERLNTLSAMHLSLAMIFAQCPHNNLDVARPLLEMHCVIPEYSFIYELLSSPCHLLGMRLHSFVGQTRVFSIKSRFPLLRILNTTTMILCGYFIDNSITRPKSMLVDVFRKRNKGDQPFHQ